jgi:hypothetical protein
MVSPITSADTIAATSHNKALQTSSDNDVGALSGTEAVPVGKSGIFQTTLTKIATFVLGSRYFQTYAALRAYTGLVTEVYIGGPNTTAQPAGIAGTFVYDPTDTTSADNGGTIIVDSSSRRWKRLYFGNVSAAWFGIVSGATSTAGTDNQAAFQACAIYCLAVGKAMEIPAGSYRTSKVDRTGISVIGAGSAATVIYGQPGQDVWYHKGTGETGYVRNQYISIQKMLIYMDTSTDVRATLQRFGGSGERVGNAAIISAGVNYETFDDIVVLANTSTFTSSVQTNGQCGLWHSYRWNGGTMPKFQVRNLSFGWITGFEDTCSTAGVNALTYSTSTNIFSYATPTGRTQTTYTTGQSVALSYDANVGTFTNLSPRKSYYVVNATSTGFQLSLTSGGAAIALTVATGTPVVGSFLTNYVYAPNEFSVGSLTLVTTECNYSCVNAGFIDIGEAFLDANRVAFRALECYGGINSGLQAAAGPMSIGSYELEGPLDTTWANSTPAREFYRFEGAYNSYKLDVAPSITANQGYSTFGTIVTNDTANLTPGQLTTNNQVVITGSRNRLAFNALSKEGNIVDQGAGNEIVFTYNGSGSDASPYFAPYLHKTSLQRKLGGVWPGDYLRVNPNAPYQSEGCLLHLGLATKFYTPPSDLAYVFGDTTLDVNGYASTPSGQSMYLQYPLGSNINSISAGRFIPAAKCTLYFKLIGLSGTPSVTLNVTGLAGATASASATVTLAATWGVYALPIDFSAMTTGQYVRIGITAATGGFGFAYMVVVPYGGPYGTASYTVPALASGAVSAIQTMTVQGAVLGDVVKAAFSLDLQGVDLRAWVSSANTVSYYFKNDMASSITLGAGTVTARVLK